LLVLLLISRASGDREPFSESVPEVRDLDSLEAELELVCDRSDTLHLEAGGLIEYGAFRAPIWVIRYRPPKASKSVLITGGVHGNEPAGTAWVNELVALLAENPERYRDVSLDLVPVVNPWGWSRDVRYNRDGQDINRDFASFESQEAVVLKDLFGSRIYDIVIDHHEDPSASGFYLYQYARCIPLKPPPDYPWKIACECTSGLSI